MFQLTPDLRFDKPALHSLVDLVNQEFSLGVTYENATIVSVEPFVDPGLTGNDLNDMQVFPTRIRVNIHLPRIDRTQEVELLYQRLVLASYLYQRVLASAETDLPALLVDYFDTTPETAIGDALAYLDTEYGVQIGLNECRVDNRLHEISADGSWPVIVTPNDDNPLWVGSVALRGRTAAA